MPRTVGYLGYELGAWIERVPVALSEGHPGPLAVFSTYDRCLAWNPEDGAVGEVVFDDTESGAALPPEPPTGIRPVGTESPGRARAAYDAGFARIMEAIRAGEIYQANLSRRLELTIDEPAVALYARLRTRQPAPYGAYLDCGSLQVLSNSPERFLRVVGSEVSTSPIKGTRRRGRDAAEDARLVAELERDPKERAEHVMIVDLERNDLGRVCRTGTVRVARPIEVQTFATVHHLVSEVRGTLRDEVGLAALLRATFPGGSITGAPKIRAMEIIAEVEASRRGIYTGAVGCMNGARSIELNVAIRTAVHKGGAVHYSAGGGIVADSGIEAEWRETETKTVAFAEALAPADRARGVAM